jgi:hypothetical protein
MTMTKPHKSNDTRDQLRQLMSRHTAATAPATVRTVPVNSTAQRGRGYEQPTERVAQTPVAATPAAPVAPAIKPPVASTPKSLSGHEKFSVRLIRPEPARIDRLILETHQRVGERITASDVLRIGLARVNDSAPITAAEIAALRAIDGRRSKQNG